MRLEHRVILLAVCASALIAYAAHGQHRTPPNNDAGAAARPLPAPAPARPPLPGTGATVGAPQPIPGFRWGGEKDNWPGERKAWR